MTIKAIETEYNGYRFRSRLEARWAVFFDACGVRWEYEPEGFELPNGMRYLPDFKLYGCTERAPETVWVEVKGEMTREDAEKIEAFACDESGYYIENPLIVLSTIPNGNTFNAILDSQQDLWSKSFKGMRVTAFSFAHLDGDEFCCHLCANGHGGLSFIGDDGNYIWDARESGNLDEHLTVEAYAKARQARFEHGEKPTI